jgi:hypothetical protein
MSRFVFFLFLLFDFRATGQDHDSVFIRKIADEVLLNSQAYRNLEVLCKTVGARLAGSPGMYKAEQWGVNTLKAMGADKVYLQPCSVPRWVRGGKDEAGITYQGRTGKQVKNTLDVLALGNSLGNGKNGVRAPVILINNFNELEQEKDKVKGKIVFYNYPFDPRYVQQGTAYGESGVYRRSGPSRAAKYGALAVFTRSLSSSSDNNPHTGSTSYDTTLPKIPCAALGLKDADMLARLLKEGKRVEGYLKTMAHFLPDTVGHNVIGELAGSEFPEEYITVGAHLDSWDVAEGAHDDGAGCVQSIEVLRALKAIGYRPKRTIRVVLFANEENGLRGANKYAEDAQSKNEKHLFALESDNGGFQPRAFELGMTPVQMNKVRHWLPLFLPYGVYEFIEGGGGADVSPLGKVMKTAIGELRPDSQRYFDLHHARNDVLENVQRRELELGALNMAALVYLVDKYGL